jgi:hypothetical protein
MADGGTGGSIAGDLDDLGFRRVAQEVEEGEGSSRMRSPAAGKSCVGRN